MIKVRLRHPRGVTTLSLDSSQTIDELRVLVFSASEIPPSEQELKYGYPPRDLPLSGTLTDIPMKSGEQIIVTSTPRTTQHTSTPEPASSLKTFNDSMSATISEPGPLNRTTEASKITTVALPDGSGLLALKVVPDDNSCLFSAIGLVFEGRMSAAPKMRQLVARIIRADSDSEYSDAFLGLPREDYVSKIQQEQTWGGAIELAAFAKHYRTEIASFDVMTGRCDKFGDGQWDQRCMLVYSGIHYDAISLTPSLDSPPDFQTTIFPVSDESTLFAASQMITQLRAEHYYTDTATFDLRCHICGQGLKGEAGAKAHAKDTGHVDFGEYQDLRMRPE